MSKQKLIGMVAMSYNDVIAIDGNLPFKSKTDMKWFKEKTSGHHVIMGRKTYNSIGDMPLPNRNNVVITRQKVECKDKLVYYTDSILNALRWCSSVPDDTRDIFIIGGAEIYKQMIPICDEVYVTLFDSPVYGDNLTKSPYPFDELFRFFNKEEVAFKIDEYGEDTATVYKFYKGE